MTTPAVYPFTGKGTQLAYSTDGTTYTAVAKLKDVKTPKLSVGKAESVTYGTIIQTPVAGNITLGECDFEIEYEKSAYAAIVALVRTTLQWKITYPDLSTELFSGFLSEIEGDNPDSGVPTRKGKIAITDLPTFDPYVS
jgi:hypothetical protein